MEDVGRPVRFSTFLSVNISQRSRNRDGIFDEATLRLTMRSCSDKKDQGHGGVDRNRFVILEFIRCATEKSLRPK